MLMKKLLSELLAACVLAVAGVCLSMTADAHSTEDADVLRVNGRVARYDCRLDQVIIKLSDTSRARVDRSAKAPVVTGVTALDDAFRMLGVTSVQPLMPNTGASTFTRKMRSYDGKPVEAPCMANAFVVNIDKSHTVQEAVETFRNLSDVEYAEPNYVIHALAEDLDINDPYYSMQYGIQDINLFKLWGEEVISKEGPIIAIIDTGVDTKHPDLVGNLWVNPSEVNGADGYDDDNNGYVDDLHGYDFINDTGAVADYNGHGTHCAGIAAACGYNGIGIIGANPFARIMPLAVMQSDGTGDIATIIRAIDYAVANGANVLSMSLGTYAESIAFREALGRAYQKAVIVAAAGNDGYCLNHAACNQPRGVLSPMPMFPAAYNFVLGVQASSSQGGLAGFSNYDDNGQVFTEFTEDKLYNYELTAPGVGIMSTYPGGQYRNLNGTSMATPLVAGALSRLLQAKEYNNREELFGDLINSLTDKGNLDIHRAYTITDADRMPSLQFVNFEMIDSDGDGDGNADAGEILEFYPVIRNAWGNVGDIKIKIENAEASGSFCEILTDYADFGQTLSSYGKGRSVNPLKIRLNDNVADGRVCRLKFTAMAPNARTIEQEFQIVAENGVEIGGVLREDMTLHSGVHYIVNKSLAVPEGVTLTIESGSLVKFKDKTGLVVSGNLVAKGEPGNMITFTKADNSTGYIHRFNTGENTLEYCIIEGFHFEIAKFKASNIIYKNMQSGHSLDGSAVGYSNIYGFDSGVELHYGGLLTTCNIVNNYSPYSLSWGLPNGALVQNSNVFNNCIDDKSLSLRFITTTPEVYTPEFPNYLGTSDKEIARSRVFDNHYPGSDTFGEYDLSNMLTRPSAEAHGIVWKVVVNGYDAQDEFDLLPPLGVGKHKFEVYFNRPMNKAKVPVVAMGVRAPYTQTAIADNGSWNEAGDVYTAYVNITGKENIDGLNRIYVAEAEDLEYFEIPLENSRFNVNVQAAGSLSTGFQAEAGMGRVDLQWEDMDMNFEDILGYNMYRYNPESEEPVLLNKTLIDAGTTTYTDYDVVPGRTYRYYYKVMTTALKENDPSKIVAVTPLTSVRGDANGSGSVDVADVLTTVNFASGLNPRPFIFEAADVNTDTEIDILDVVGIVGLIVGVPQGSMLQSMPEAIISVSDGKLWIDSPVDLAGVQFDFTTSRSNSITALAALDGFEKTGAWQNDNTYRFLAYNLTGLSIPAGKNAILEIGDAEIADARLSNPAGQNVEAKFSTPNGVKLNRVDSNLRLGALPGIYTLTGIKVADKAEDIDALPNGIYIVNGWKVVK